MEIAYCGFNCAKCPAYIATVTNNENMKKQLAEESRKNLNKKVNPEDIECMGCKSDSGIIIDFCYECEVRNCAINKDVKNCAYCNNYDDCSILCKLFEQMPSAKETLDKLRKEV